jgi:hypothetical protein
MKKLLFLGFTVLAAMSANAQNLREPIVRDQGIRAITPARAKSTKITRRAGTSELYNYVDAYSNSTSNSSKTTLFWIAPDSNACVVYSTSGKSNINFHGVGGAFDPKDTTFLDGPNTILTKFNPYHIDTIRFRKGYVRNVNNVKVGGNMVNVVDTLYVQYYDASGMNITAYSYQSDPLKKSYYYGVPKGTTFVPYKATNKSALKTDTLLLTAADADSFNISAGNYYPGLITLTPNFNSLSTNTTPVTNNVIAYSINFKPMIPAQLNDTIMDWTNSKYTKKTNGFAVSLAYFDKIPHDNLTTPYKINNTFWTYSELLPGVKVNIWQGYVPTTLYGTAYMMNTDIHITCDNLSTKELMNSNIGLAVYPNPSSTNNNATAVVNLKSASMVSTKVYDMNGRVVLATSAKSMNAGLNELPLATSNLSTGIYTVTIETAAGTKSSKFIVK